MNTQKLDKTFKRLLFHLNEIKNCAFANFLVVSFDFCIYYELHCDFKLVILRGPNG